METNMPTVPRAIPRREVQDLIEALRTTLGIALDELPGDPVTSPPIARLCDTIGILGSIATHDVPLAIATQILVEDTQAVHGE